MKLLKSLIIKSKVFIVFGDEEKMQIIDLSKFSSGQEFADVIFNSKDICFQLINEDQNPILNKMNEKEEVPKFKIGDRVRLEKELSKFNGIENDEIYTVIGLESYELTDQFLYRIRNEEDVYTFFGYELEKA